MVRYATGLALSYGTDCPAVLALERRHLTDAGLAFARRKTGQRPISRWSDDLRATAGRPTPKMVDTWAGL